MIPTGPLRGLGLTLAMALIFTAEAQVLEVPPAGTFRMRPELVGQHPRLYFTAQDIPEIRRQGLGERKWFFDHAKGSFGQYRGQPAELRHDWKDYLYGFWAQFFMDLAFLIEQEQGWADTAKSWALFFARNRSDWLADDLVPMEITTGMALTYDILYDQFSEAERGELRAALFAAADFIYQEFFIGEYWTNDLLNNHMHNRIHGLMHAAFAIWGDDPDLDVQKHADLAVAAFREVARWFPEDGSTHEGPGYWSYGWHWVVRAGHLMEHVTGNDPLAATAGFAHIPAYRIYLTAPGWQETFGIGDSGGGTPDNPECLARVIAKQQDAHGAAVFREWMRSVPDAFYQHTAWGLLWYDGEMAERPYAELPLWHFWPDLEMFSVRSSWDPDATALVFKCGPPGGHHMQQLRGDNWVNVAHDHPDQNHFLLFAHGKMMAQDDGYPTEKKLTRSHNTLLFDGQGGPREDTGWYQPFPYEQTATMDDVFLTRSSAFATGNATRLYAAQSPAAAQVVRHLLFVEGEYLIIIDELAANDGAEHDFEWRLHKEGAWSDRGPGWFQVADGDVQLDIHFLAPEAGALTSQFLPVELTAPPCLSVRTRGRETHFISVLVPQHNGQPVVQADLPQATGALAVRAIRGTVTDLFGVAPVPSSVSLADLEASGAAALVRRDGGELRLALLVRGTSLTQTGRLLLSASQPANLAFRPSAAGGMLEAEAPYKSAGGLTEVAVGGLAAGHTFHVTINGTAATDVAADSAGVARMTLDLSSRREMVLTDAGAVVEDGGDAGAADGGDGGMEDGEPDESEDAGPRSDSPGKMSGSCACNSASVESAWWPIVLAWFWRRCRGNRSVRERD